jgi:TRAP-type mannitol/chloroaromatic compound transport system permease small subunit
MDFLALMFMSFFAGLVSWKIWALVLDSFESGIRSSTYLLTPQWIPEGILGIGFSLLALASAAMGIAIIVEWTGSGATVESSESHPATWKDPELGVEGQERF